ncbi:PIN domain-containing protein [Bdellovibrionota bacterium FG-2]
MISSRILIDTSVLISYLRGALSPEILVRTLDGRAPLVSPVTLHELRRGIRPGSVWESQIDRLVPSQTVLAPAPSHQEWLDAADVIRSCFGKTRLKTELAILTHDVLIALTAKTLQAELWSRDQDFKLICQTIGVVLLDH